jgi:SpoVK/Ycf46/Vps4 family AAA+-type ATPase
MSSKTEITLSWTLDLADPHAIPNARLVRGLVRCIQRLPGAFPRSNYDDLAEALAPVLQAMRPALIRAIKSHLQSSSLHSQLGLELDLESPALLQSAGALTLIGEGLSGLRPGFRSLVQKIVKFLDDFVAAHPHPTDQNLEQLAKLLAFKTHEVEYLRLATASSLASVPRSLFNFLPVGPRLFKALEYLCEGEPRQIRRLFDATGALARAGLLEGLSGRYRTGDLEDMLRLSELGDRLLTSPFSSSAEMAAEVLMPLEAGCGGQTLVWPHLSQQQALLAAVLSEALAQRTRGVNILLHGASGTGKTAFARQLISEIGAHGFAVHHADADGDEASRGDRLASLALSQCFAAQQDRVVLVLDEAEDVFQRDYQNPLARVFGRQTESKAWINNLLESNPTPVIWISNKVDYLDPAFLRRFSFCLEFPRTPFSVRRKIAQAKLGELGCTEETLDAVARDDGVSPASVSAAAQFACLAKASGVDVDTAVLIHLDEQTRTRGNRKPRLIARRTQRFDIRYLNLDGNVQPEELVQALMDDPTAAVLFSGPPGTGKTQFAAEIADRLDRQLVVRTASDINSKWYGESEGNVAAMFRDCDPKAEILFLDEAEILMASRESSSQRADRAVTAEFLRWLEVFEGTFVCATNHAAEFDAALMRRFAFRLHFKPLSTEQRCRLFAEHALGWSPATAAEPPELGVTAKRRLERLDLLTPGDFANAGRRARRLCLSAEGFLVELEAEHAAKGCSVQRRIGFA